MKKPVIICGVSGQGLPKDGHIAIFDRTWYGRVMVERLEGFCSENDWRRAYNEINEFEKELSDWGAVIVKFWVHIDKDTQLARFNDRQSNPEKQWKITDEDWRNREKWDQYETAVDEMLQKDQYCLCAMAYPGIGRQKICKAESTSDRDRRN